MINQNSRPSLLFFWNTLLLLAILALCLWTCFTWAMIGPDGRLIHRGGGDPWYDQTPFPDAHPIETWEKDFEHFSPTHLSEQLKVAKQDHDLVQILYKKAQNLSIETGTRYEFAYQVKTQTASSFAQSIEETIAHISDPKIQMLLRQAAQTALRAQIVPASSDWKLDVKAQDSVFTLAASEVKSALELSQQSIESYDPILDRLLAIARSGKKGRDKTTDLLLREYLEKKNALLSEHEKVVRALQHFQLEYPTGKVDLEFKGLELLKNPLPAKFRLAAVAFENQLTAIIEQDFSMLQRQVEDQLGHKLEWAPNLKGKIIITRAEALKIPVWYSKSGLFSTNLMIIIEFWVPGHSYTARSAPLDFLFTERGGIVFNTPEALNTRKQLQEFFAQELPLLYKKLIANGAEIMKLISSQISSHCEQVLLTAGEPTSKLSIPPTTSMGGGKSI